jgi:hypothetical protein
MATYMTRVELHDAAEEDYEILHAAMEAEGFERTITGASGTMYHLPPAEYRRKTELVLSDVLASAKRAATKTKKSFGAVVTQSAGITMVGLKPVE